MKVFLPITTSVIIGICSMSAIEVFTDNLRIISALGIVITSLVATFMSVGESQ